MRRTITVLVAVLILAAPGIAQTSYTIAFGDAGPPAPFAPLRHAGPHWVASSFVFDTLIWRNERSAIPWLAESWSWGPSRTRIRVRLRGDVRWHDGRPFTAEDVRFTFELLRNKPELSNQGELVRTYVERIEAPDLRTVLFRFRQPLPDFLEFVLGWERIVPAHIWGSIRDPLAYQGFNRYVGTGPFRVREYRSGQYYLFEANPHYFAGKPRVDRLILRPVANAVIALRQGEVDAATLPARLAREFAGQSGFALTPPQATYFYTKLVFNTARPPTDAREFRQAIAFGVNRERLIRQVLQGDGILASPGGVHPESPWFARGLPDYSYDPDRAVGLLTRIGYRQASGTLVDAQGRPVQLTLHCRGAANVRACQLLKEDLERLGMRIDIKVLETAPMEEVLSKGEFTVALEGHGGTFLPRSEPDFPARIWRNPRYDQLYDAFLRALTERQRIELAAQMQRIAAEELPSLPLYHPLDQAVYRPVSGIRLFWTRGGLAGRGGPPSFYNKLAFLEERR